MKIGILGGGLLGLSLGHFLNERNRDFRILEKDALCAGLLRSVSIDKFTFDTGGSHIIFSKNREVLNLMIRLLDDNLIASKRRTKIVYKNKLIGYPFENHLAGLDKNETFECLLYFIQNQIEKEKCNMKSPANLKEWFYFTFGKGISEKYLIPYNEKIWKYPIDEMSTEWVERIPNPPIEDIIKSSLGILTEGYIHQSNFYYPKTGGIQSLAKALEYPIKEKIAYNYIIKNIKKINDKWVISGNPKIVFDKLISSIPLHDLIRLLDDVPTDISNKVNSLKYNSLISIAIGVDVQKINNLSWLYIPDKNILAHRVSFPSNFSPNVAPKDKSAILAEITFRDGDKISEMRDNEIVEKTIDDLEVLGIIKKRDVVTSSIYKSKYAYVIHDMKYKDNIRIIGEYFNELGLDTIGRFARWEYLNMDETIAHAKTYVEANFAHPHKLENKVN